MLFIKSLGIGTTSVTLKIVDILSRLKYIWKGHRLTVTRDDLVQYIGHIAPKTKKIIRKAMGAFYLLMKRTIFINPIMRVIMNQKQLKFYYKLWKIKV